MTFEELEMLYNEYKHSLPTPENRYDKSYFKALEIHDIPLNKLVNDKNSRQKAKEKLELTFLMGVLNGSITWPDDSKWFIQSDTDKDFIILREWVTCH